MRPLVIENRLQEDKEEEKKGNTKKYFYIFEHNHFQSHESH